VSSSGLTRGSFRELEFVNLRFDLLICFDNGKILGAEPENDTNAFSNSSILFPFLIKGSLKVKNDKEVKK
jgi:hypothetical protein